MNKTKKITRKIMALLLAVVMTAGVLLTTAPVALAASETISQWNTPPAAAEAVLPASTGTGTLSHSNGSTINTSSTGYNPTVAGAWSHIDSNGRFWQLGGISTSNFNALSIRVNARSSGTGPRDFKIFYSTDGVTYHPATDNDVDYVAGNAAWVNNQTVSLPEGAGGAATLFLRLVNITNISARAGTGTFSATDPVASGGTSQINYITIIGTRTGTVVVCPDCEKEPCECTSPTYCDDCENDPCICPTAPVITPVATAITLPLGTVVTVEGVLVYNIRNAGGTSDNGVFLQDENGAGINVRPGTGSVTSTQVRNLIGQKVRVTGEIGNFSGLVQLQNRSGSSPQLFTIEVIDTNPTVPQPIAVSLQEINERAFPFRLVSVEDVQLISKHDTWVAGHSLYTIGREGVTASLYGPSALPAGVAVGDWITITRGVLSTGGFTATANAHHLYVNSESAADIIPGNEVQPPGERESIAEWRSPSVPAGTLELDATGGEFAADAKLSIVGTTAVTLSWANAAINRAGGFDGKAGTAYWLFETSSEDYRNIQVSLSARSSATGPRDFRIQFSTDGEIWRDALSPTFVVGNAFGINDDRSQFSATLPALANGAKTLYIRVLQDTNTSTNGGVIAAGGTNSINNIVITGEYVPNPNQLLPPTTDTPSGDVPVGHVISFTRDVRDEGVAGYAVMVSTDNGATWTEAVDGKFTLTNLPATLLVRAEAPGKDNSRTITYNFEHAKLPLVTASRNSGAVIPGATIRLENAIDAVTIKYQINNGAILDYTDALVLDDSLFIGEPPTLTVRVWAERVGFITGDESVFSYTRAQAGGERIYFGQIHSHTTLSDGVGEVEEAYAYARDVAGLDFFAVTDHSNSFVHTDPVHTDPALIDLNTHNATSVSWQRKLAAAAAAYRPDEFISFYGFEMTWSGGPGHINTFGTGGFVSRNNTFLNNKVNDAGMRAYYELLKRTPNSISMFCHPGTTFGNFNNFAYHDSVLNQRITLVEVGNGEGGVGGGYWRSYDQYILALDKGWKLAPVNSQDNHLGAWGDSNTHRTAIWTNDLSLAGVFQAMRDMRVYATEVADLEIVYKVNGQPLGETLDVVPPVANFTAEIVNPTAGNIIKSVHLVTNGGTIVGRVTPNAQNYNYNHVINTPAPGYYFLWVVVGTPDGDRIAVTAPVWLGQGKLAGFSNVTQSAIMPVTTEELEITATLFNNETRAATLMSIRYTDQNGAVLYEDAALEQTLAANNGTFTHSMKLTPAVAGNKTVTITATIRFADGTEHIYRSDLTLEVRDIDRLVFVGIDASHNNAYVAGQYVDAVRNFINLAADHDVRSVILRTEAELIAAAKNPRFGMLVFSSPDRHTTVNPHLSYSNAVVEAVAEFAAQGNTVLINGLGNWNERNSRVPGYENTISGNQNRLLAAIGSHLRVSEDSAYDDDKNRAGNHTPLFNTPDVYELSHPLLAGVVGTQTFSKFSGSSLYVVDETGAVVTQLENMPAGVSPMVWGNATTYSSNQNVIAGRVQQGGPRYGNQEGAGGFGPGRVMIAASEEVTFANGNTASIIVTGAVMQSDFEVREPDNAAQLPNSNFNISRNIIRSIAPQAVITDIAEARTLPHGTNVVVEAIVTSNVNANNNEINTGFFDSIYVQDATGGINLFPVSSGVVVGQKVRVSGSISEFQGETQISVARIEVIDASINEVAPTKLTTAEAMSPASTGLLVTVTGRVSDVRTATSGMVMQFTVTDDSGVGATIFINAYISTIVDLSSVQEGALVSVTGLASIGETDDSNQGQPRIRVRDRNEITLAESSGIVKSASNARFINIAETSKNSRVWVLTFNALVEYMDGSREIKTYSINLRGNNANLDGRYTFIAGHDLAGMTLMFDIKGNGSNIKMFELR